MQIVLVNNVHIMKVAASMILVQITVMMVVWITTVMKISIVWMMLTFLMLMMMLLMEVSTNILLEEMNLVMSDAISSVSEDEGDWLDNELSVADDVFFYSEEGSGEFTFDPERYCQNCWRQQMVNDDSKYRLFFRTTESNEIARQKLCILKSSRNFSVATYTVCKQCYCYLKQRRQYCGGKCKA